MHFFYIDESGDTGGNLLDPDQPIMVLGGISLNDQKWYNTQRSFKDTIFRYFQGQIPENFELHTNELLSPNGEGPFENHSRNERNQLVLDLLNSLSIQNHNVHLIAFDKRRINDNDCGSNLAFNPSRPYLLGFDYLITYINWFLQQKRGQTSRGLIILDEKENYHRDIENIMHNRRFETVRRHQVRQIVEFGYPVDSKKNPMIQLSDLVIFCTKKFFELENGYANLPIDAQNFYAQCFDIIKNRISRQGLINRGEGNQNIRRLNTYLSEVRSIPRTRWRTNYNI